MDIWLYQKRDWFWTSQLRSCKHHSAPVWLCSFLPLQEIQDWILFWDRFSQLILPLFGFLFLCALSMWNKQTGCSIQASVTFLLVTNRKKPESLLTLVRFVCYGCLFFPDSHKTAVVLRNSNLMLFNDHWSLTILAGLLELAKLPVMFRQSLSWWFAQHKLLFRFSVRVHRCTSEVAQKS